MAEYKGPVEVTWEDAAGHNQWEMTRDAQTDFAQGAYEVQSVGYIVARTPRSLTLAQSRTLPGCYHGDQVNHMLRIPLGMVRKVRRL